MRVSEQITAVKLELDQASDLLAPVFFTDQEILYWLNIAQLALVKQKLFGNNTRKEGFEQSQKRTDDLLTLVKEEASIVPNAAAAHLPNTYYINTTDVGDANNLYMYFLDARVYDGVNYYDTEIIRTDLLKDFLETPYNKPYLERPVIHFSGDDIFITMDPDADAPTHLYVKYIKRPKTLMASGVTQPYLNINDIVTNNPGEIEIISDLGPLANGDSILILDAGGTYQVNGNTYTVDTVSASNLDFTILENLGGFSSHTTGGIIGIYSTETSELPAESHDELTALCVNMMLESATSERVKTNDNKLNKME